MTGANAGATASIGRPEDVELLMEHAEIDRLSLVKVHSHPLGYPRFSEVDDATDAELLPTIRSWVEADVPHASAIMLPSGRMFGRYLWCGEEMHDIDLVNVVGPELKFWWSEEGRDDLAFGASQDQASGEGTTRKLRRLRVGVIGASGTGSPTIEQLVRLGVGHVVEVDSDPVAAAQQVQDKYIKGLRVQRPAVISVNMFASSLTMNDFLARLHPYRRSSNADVASIEFSLGELRLTVDEEMEDCPVIATSIGLGDRSPWLGLPQLGAL